MTNAATDSKAEAFKAAVSSGDAGELRRLAARMPGLKDVVNEPFFSFDSPAIVCAGGNLEMVDALLELGADINARSRWWAGGFGVLDNRDPDQAEALIRRGACVDVHSAAALGLVDELRRLLDRDPALVNAPGGDGMRPLHFASSAEVIDLLVDRGADLNIRDTDHHGTPAQHQIDNEDLCRRLLERGAEPDIFIACALGDAEAAERVLGGRPSALQDRIGRDPYTAPGGHIYTYKLTYTARPLPMAAARGHARLVEYLLSNGSPADRLVFACVQGDEDEANSILRQNPGLIDLLPAEDRALLSDAAWDNNLKGAEVMLRAGFPVDAPRIDNATALDRAVLRGYSEMVRLLLRHGPSLEVKNEWGATPLRTCIWASVNWHEDRGAYPDIVDQLIQAGAPVPETVGGSKEVAELLLRHGANAP